MLVMEIWLVDTGAFTMQFFKFFWMFKLLIIMKGK